MRARSIIYRVLFSASLYFLNANWWIQGLKMSRILVLSRLLGSPPAPWERVARRDNAVSLCDADRSLLCRSLSQRHGQDLAATGRFDFSGYIQLCGVRWWGSFSVPCLKSRRMLVRSQVFLFRECTVRGLPSVPGFSLHILLPADRPITMQNWVNWTHSIDPGMDESVNSSLSLVLGWKFLGCSLALHHDH